MHQYTHGQQIEDSARQFNQLSDLNRVNAQRDLNWSMISMFNVAPGVDNVTMFSTDVMFKARKFPQTRCLHNPYPLSFSQE